MKCFQFVPKKERGVRRPWKYFSFSSEMYNEDECRGSCWVWKASWIPIVKEGEQKKKTRRNGKRIHYTLEWTLGASCNLGKKSLNSFYKGISWYLVTKTGVDRFEKCLSTKIMSALFSDSCSNVFTPRPRLFENFKFVP